jgi:arylformamidase
MSALPNEAWRRWPRAELEREYSPSTTIADLGAEIDGYRAASAAARDTVTPRVVRYGSKPSETLDLFLPTGTGPHPALVYLHGGYWQELSKNESAFMVPALVRERVGVAVVDYQLAPAARLETIVEQCAAACAYLAAEAARVGLDSGRLVVAGSSAGGHLAAMVLGRTDGLAGGVLLSGVYDLRPLVGTYINEALRLDEPAAERLSPLGRPMCRPVPLVIAVGENETSEFHRQTAEFAADRRRAGHPVAERRVAGRHHFDLPYDLGDARSELGRLTLDLVRLGALSR